MTDKTTYVIDSSLQTAAFLGAGFGPAGMIFISAPALALEMIFKLTDGTPKPLSIPEVLNQELTARFTEAAGIDAITSINNVFQWFYTAHNEDWDFDEPNANQQEQYDSFERTLTAELTPDSSLQHNVLKLKNPPYHLTTLPVYLLGGSLWLTLRMTDIMMHSVNIDPVTYWNFPQLLSDYRNLLGLREGPVEEQTPDTYTFGAHKTMLDIQAEIDKRLGKITEISREGDSWVFYDQGTPGKATPFPYEKEIQAKSAKDAYSKDVKTQQIDQYFGSSHGYISAVKTIEKWQDTYEKYLEYYNEAHE
ncbi:hypothetical protein SCOR_24310 [Sulfidibacter corallicola]|uniref:Uncharacterized protein n=1 Tax=Sulfidibacter corallicola TaxID=2818388 RepID=A0A8A4TSV1_SULCO|nr:hypothetical protein [Sulfidibacter corallicola]QTD52467.1 hypothetical protein J3U87_08345 [Sulfidibacter corallicola]